MSPLKIAFFTTFIDLLGFGIIIPIQPFYAKSFGVSATIVTLLGAWCELRGESRSFRTDRIDTAESTGLRFDPRNGALLAELLAARERTAGA